MNNIKISNLDLVGSILFQDSESFLHELTNLDMDNIVGGFNLAEVTTLNSNNLQYVNSANTLGQTYNTYSQSNYNLVV